MGQCIRQNVFVPRKENNSFATDLGDNCVVADFYGKTVAFN